MNYTLKTLIFVHLSLKTILMSKINLIALVLLIAFPVTAQTKKIKRPRNTVGISSVDTFVRESFELYDKVYMYDGYAAAGKSLEDEDIDILEDALSNLSALSESAPDIISDLDGTGALKQAKAVLQMNRAKKALKYSIKTAKALLAGQRSSETTEETNSTSQPSSQQDETTSTGDTGDDTSTEASSQQESETGASAFKINSKFDFVPGDKLLFFDDYSSDFIGDFPSKWNTNGTGEVVTVNDESQRYLKMVPGYGLYYLPLIDDLPESYTIEFDVITNGVDGQTSSQAKLHVELIGEKGFENAKYLAKVSIPFAQYAPQGIQVSNYTAENGRTINSTVTADIRKAVMNKPHFSIAVNKERYRFWVNEKKYIDIPKLIPAQKLKGLRFQVGNFKDGKEELFFTNLKIAEGGVDLRRTLMATGKVSTNGILFATGSAKIQPQSYGILRQISQVLQQDKNMRLQIVGHTDSDGPDAANLTLSKARAAAVKTALQNTYNVDASRLTVDGKGESVPVANNTTPDGKAQNRRVEFIKM